MYARSTTFLARVSSIDEGIAHIRDEVLPALTGMEGCIGLSLLVDRDSGRCIATSVQEPTSSRVLAPGWVCAVGSEDTASKKAATRTAARMSRSC